MSKDVPPELLEHILAFLLYELLPVTDREDPRSVRTHGNAAILLHLLRCSEVSRSWNECILGSKRLLRALFLLPDTQTKRVWDINHSTSVSRQLYSYYTAPCLRAPQLNPIIQSTFSTYHFRFWHLSYDSTGNKHVAYLIITRRDFPAIELRSRTGHGRSISSMLLSQPPPTALEATIWEERDETKDYVDRTSALSDPSIVCETGVTVGLVHERVATMFDKHQDVAAIKLTTV